MRSPEHAMRTIVRCAFRCKHCREIIGSENVAFYGRDLPGLIKPTWFFASMVLLDHLRDCTKMDHSAELRAQYGDDFLNHPRIWEWFNRHGLVERKVVAEEELDERGHMGGRR